MKALLAAPMILCVAAGVARAQEIEWFKPRATATGVGPQGKGEKRILDEGLSKARKEFRPVLLLAGDWD